MSWSALFALGVFHGVNPAMGWLFAVSFGLQEGRLSAVLRALGPIALGHELAVVVVAVPLALAGAGPVAGVVTIVGALVLIAFGAWRLWTRRGHPRWVGMRLKPHELIWWSALMAGAHGAGLMLLPVFTREPDPGHLQAAPLRALLEQPLLAGLLAAGAHTLGMLAAAAVVAVAAYQWLGLSLLRRSWVNLDRVWAVALIGAGAFTLFT
jgi:hypothetical protein